MSQETQFKAFRSLMCRVTCCLLIAFGAAAHTKAEESSEACAAGAAVSFPSNATPGIHEFKRAIHAVKDRDQKAAIRRLKISASWGEKIAQYDLGLMYWKGDGVSKDRAMAVAWLALADQRHNSARIEGSLQYAYGKLDAKQRQQADVDFGTLVKTYGDKVALTRARMAWRRSAQETTGSRLGFTGDLLGGSGVRESYLQCNPYWPYPLKEDLGSSQHPSAQQRSK